MQPIEHATVRHPLAYDLANNIAERSLYGSTLVLCASPRITLSAIRRQWFPLLRRIQKQRASTTNYERIANLENQLAYLSSLKFSTKPLPGDEYSTIFITDYNTSLGLMPPFATIYIVAPYPESILSEVVRYLAPQGLAILCEEQR